MLIIIIVLIIIVGVFAFMNKEIAIDNLEAHQNAEIILKDGNKEIRYGNDYITELGEMEFNAVLDTSDTDPKTHIYAGIPLINLIEDSGINIEDKDQIIVRAVDGYTVALNTKEAEVDDNVYIVYKVDGKLMKTRENGGSGPYQLIIKNDQFSQRWVKYLVEIEIR